MVAFTGRAQRLRAASACLGFVIGILACGSGHADDGHPIGADSKIVIRVDPRVELFSTIHRLAGTNQYDTNELPGYIREVEGYFGPFRDHPAVRLAQDLRGTHHLDGNSPMALAVYLTNPPELKGRASLIPPPPDLDPRWTADAIPRFLAAVRRFAHDTDFRSFFDDHREFYELSVANLHATLKDTDVIPWFRDFFGYRPDDFVIILGLQNGICNYGASVTLHNGKKEFNSLLGGSRPDRKGAPRYPRRGYLPIIVHEFCHSYANPLVDRHKEALREAGEKLFPLLKKQLSRQGYNTWFVMMCEYLTRACVLRYLAANEDEDDVETRVREDERSGFPGIRALAALLEDYETRRATYPDLDSFLPRIVEHFDRYVETLH
jgi:hypothetical protein